MFILAAAFISYKSATQRCLEKNTFLNATFPSAFVIFSINIIFY
ncbi:hypothetical protein Pint_20879 [Pistacia integerrima]|uniref:Uncharacterized protein n=1 Tax=Pistacia integerrima TaxID=434235 RepID=A0ACC0XEC5_9ROSI|nr:hypothetical protein Pint_20879 [Pistacia integerrima]